MPLSLTLTASATESSALTGGTEGSLQHSTPPMGLNTPYPLALQGVAPAVGLFVHEKGCCHDVQELELDIPDAAHFVVLLWGNSIGFKVIGA